MNKSLKKPSSIRYLKQKKRESVCVREKKRESAWEKWGWKVEEYRANRPANNGHCGQRWAYRNKGSTVVVLISKYLLTLRSIYWTWTQIFLIAKKKCSFFLNIYMESFRLFHIRLCAWWFMFLIKMNCIEKYAM